MKFLDIFRRRKKVLEATPTVADQPRSEDGKKVVKIAWYSGGYTPTDIAGLRMGTQKTTVMKLCCGNCKNEWQDAVEPNKLMRLTCPRCGAVNEFTDHTTIIM